MESVANRPSRETREGVASTPSWARLVGWQTVPYPLGRSPTQEVTGAGGHQRNIVLPFDADHPHRTGQQSGHPGPVHPEQ